MEPDEAHDTLQQVTGARPFRRKRGDEGTGRTEAVVLEPGTLYQLGGKALFVELRDGEPVLVCVSEVPTTPPA